MGLLVGHAVETVAGRGWSGVRNGELLKRAGGEFDVFLTMDRRLPEQQRIALTLSYFDDIDNAGIAEIMGNTISAVESLLKRGRQALRDRLRRSERDFRQALMEA